ncbi:sulfatase family protein [Luteipulveratus mongoliensis]|uniref:sulfatase family protein n=1 Tax=Luteipulveratus mongoliensis TaxID=571913 RepID=UPI0009FA1AB4|nr:sulfatase [Luteipulveratus mongoliensis]
MARNILLLHAHDLGRFVGCYGVSTVQTPDLDAFARDATTFDLAFASAPHCSPARASLFTGTSPQHNGVLGLTHAPFAWDLREPRTHIAHRLHDVGYRTELVGVHHESLVLDDEAVASRLGFDRVRTGGGRDLVVERAVEALEGAAQDERPFYLQVGFHEPHRTPSRHDEPGVMGFLGEGFGPDDSRGVTVPAYLIDEDGSRREIAELQGAVRHMDEGVGSILRRLGELGLSDDTVVVFTTDHGLPMPRAKCTLYDPGLEVALLVRVPGRPAWVGRRVPDMVSHLDVVPTLLDLVGQPVPTDVEGQTLTQVVESSRPTSRFTFGHLSHHTYFDPKRSVRSATHKLVANFANAPKVMDPTQSWVHRSRPVDLAGSTVGTSPAFELYDLVADPLELTNLASEPATAAIGNDLATELLAWMRRVDDPLLDVSARTTTGRHRLVLAGLESGCLTSTAGDGARPWNPDPTNDDSPDHESREMESA